MRFDLQLQLTRLLGKGLPINYQYPISHWLDDLLLNESLQLRNWLYEHGFEDRGRKFKFYTFSRLWLLVAKPQPEGRLSFQGDFIRLTVGIHLPDELLPLLEKIFVNQTGEIADELGGIQFRVTRLVPKPIAVLAETMRFRTASPVYVSLRHPRTGNEVALAPDDKEFEHAVFTALCSKYNAHKEEAPTLFDREKFAIRIVDTEPIRERLIRLKYIDEKPVLLRTFDFLLEITAEPPLMQMAIDCGIGRSNPQGFGMLELLPTPEPSPTPAKRKRARLNPDGTKRRD